MNKRRKYVGGFVTGVSPSPSHGFNLPSCQFLLCCHLLREKVGALVLMQLNSLMKMWQNCWHLEMSSPRGMNRDHNFYTIHCSALLLMHLLSLSFLSPLLVYGTVGSAVWFWVWLRMLMAVMPGDAPMDKFGVRQVRWGYSPFLMPILAIPQMFPHCSFMFHFNYLDQLQIVSNVTV